MIISITIGGETPASVALNSVIRTDTDAELLVSPLAMTLSNGAWQAQITEPAAGLTYSYEYAITWDDGSVNEQEGTAEGIAGAEGDYVSRDMVEQIMGTDNLNLQGNLDNDATIANEAVLDAAFSRTDEWVDRIAFVMGYQPESNTRFVLSGNRHFLDIRNIASQYASTEIYQLRGQVGAAEGDQVPAPEGQMSQRRARAEKDLRELFTIMAAEQRAASYTTDGATVINAACRCGWGGGINVIL